MEDLERAQTAAAVQASTGVPVAQPALSPGLPCSSSIQGLEAEYQRLEGLNVAAMSQDSQERHCMEISRVIAELEAAQMAEVHLHEQHASSHNRPSKKLRRKKLRRHVQANIASLADATRDAERVQALAARYAELTSMDPSTMSSEEVEQHILTVSSVMAELEAAHISFAQTGAGAERVQALAARYA